MRRLLRMLCLMGALAAGAVAVAAEGDDGVTDLGDIKELAFGVISTESSANLRKGFDPFAEELSKKLGMPVKAFYATDYAGVIEGMRFGKVHMAWFGNKSAMEAAKRARAEIFCQTVDADGNPGYWSLILVHKDSPYQDLDGLIQDASKLSFGNGDPNSTSGYLIPTYYIWAARGIDPKKTFKDVRSANHEANAIAVANKQIDFCTNNTENLSKLQKNKPEIYNNLRFIWKSPLIPSDPICWRKDLPADLKAKIKQTFLDFGRKGDNVENELAILAAMSSGWKPFNDSTNYQLLPILEIDLVKDKKKIEAKEGLADDEKQKQVAELDTQIQDIRAFTALYEQLQKAGADEARCAEIRAKMEQAKAKNTILGTLY